jgi:2-oxoglutarate dehydrogenase complex dehydrogenase (E1) component-like enzyme
MAAASLQRRLAATSFLHPMNADFLQALQPRYARNPESVGVDWRDLFAWLGDERPTIERESTGPAWAATLPCSNEPTPVKETSRAAAAEARVSATTRILVNAHRNCGDPLGLTPAVSHERQESARLE